MERQPVHSARVIFLARFLLTGAVLRSLGRIGRYFLQDSDSAKRRGYAWSDGDVDRGAAED